MPKKEITISLEMDRETKNTVRFTEAGPREEHIMGKAYIKKKDLETIGSPRSIKLKIVAS